ncbi:MAG TPA: hypothetical protein PLG90_01810 [Ignavibacteria bacterium]|nr:hypothetical protein [Ignavibacteria bacterium]
MKKLFTLFLFVFIGISASQVSAQSYVDYTWDTYDLKFKIPKTFEVVDNNSEKFSAGNDAVWLTIYPKTGSNLKYSEMIDMLTTWAKENDVYAYGTVKTEINFNGFWGVYLDGKLASNDLPVYCAMFVHPDFPSQYYYVWINYNKNDIDIAEQILLSIKPM